MLERIINTTSYIRNRLDIPEGDSGRQPEVGIILGSGLGVLGERIENPVSLPYDEIPDFPKSTVAGHQGRFIYGMLGGKRVIAMQGRVHYYEGYPMQDVVLPVRAMCRLGIHTLIVSNAAGGVSPLFQVGDIMVIEDHINLLPNPLIGPNMDELGTRFPDMSQAYDKNLIALAHAEALVLGIKLRQGCYVGSTGPTFETPAEYRYFKTIGADATGMSTTPEVIVARHQGVRVLGFSLISNIGVEDRLIKRDPALEQCEAIEKTAIGIGDHQDVMNAGRKAGPVLSSLVEAIIAKM